MTVMGAARRTLIAFALTALPGPLAAQAVGPWQSLVAEASSRFGIPQPWIWRVIDAESGGRTTRHGRPVRSRVGAMGLMQLMPGTWQAMRQAHGLGSDPDDPRDNILAGTAYLRRMYDRFGYPGLFAAYNAGPERFADHLARGRRLPAETVAYVRKVVGEATVGSEQAPGILGGDRPSSIWPLALAPAASKPVTAISPRESVFFPIRDAERPLAPARE